MGMNINEVLEKIKTQGTFPNISRISYIPYDMKVSLRVVEAIGKSRNNRFVIDDENRFTYENMIRWIHGDPEMKCFHPETGEVISGRLDAGIFIGGSTGSGKSWAMEIMNAYCKIDDVQIKFGKIQKPINWGNVRSDAICDEYTATGSIERFKKMSIVCIQDFGAEPSESLHMGNRVNVLRQIIESRGDRTDQITLITSNLRPNHQWTIDRYGVRVSSRLNEMCNYFEIKGKDRRKL